MIDLLTIASDAYGAERKLLVERKTNCLPAKEVHRQSMAAALRALADEYIKDSKIASTDQGYGIIGYLTTVAEQAP